MGPEETDTEIKKYSSDVDHGGEYLKNNSDNVAKMAADAFREFQEKKQMGHKAETIGASDSENSAPPSVNMGVEIGAALEEYSKKQKVEQGEKREKYDQYSNLPKMVRIIIKISGGSIKNEKQANYVLLGISIIIFIVSGYLFFIGFGGNKSLKMNQVPAINPNMIPGTQNSNNSLE